MAGSIGDAQSIDERGQRDPTGGANKFFSEPLDAPSFDMAGVVPAIHVLAIYVLAIHVLAVRNSQRRGCTTTVKA
jgi:hypothetical protein